ncbi:MAG: hypothetical protein H6864_09390 [Micavibrio sp.]|nr:hypothetical protein [Micavibrio sp.]
MEQLNRKDQTLIQLYERKIKEKEQARMLASEKAKQAYAMDMSYESAVGTVFDFIGNPLSIWDNGDLEDKRLVIKLVFSKRLPYNQKQGFGTDGIELPFTVMRDLSTNKRKMVVCTVTP